MTRKFVTDEQLGMLFRRYVELTDRLRTGRISFVTAYDGMQDLVEGTPGRRAGAVTPRVVLQEKPAVRLVRLEEPGTIADLIATAKAQGDSAGVYEYFRKHEDQMPEEWKGNFIIIFPDVVAGEGTRRNVACAFWRGDRWGWNVSFLKDSVSKRDRAIVVA